MSNPLGLDLELLEVLACPCPAHASLRVDASKAALVCSSCGTVFEVRNGIPILLLDEA